MITHPVRIDPDEETEAEGFVPVLRRFEAPPTTTTTTPQWGETPCAPDDIAQEASSTPSSSPDTPMFDIVRDIAETPQWDSCSE